MNDAPDFISPDVPTEDKMAGVREVASRFVSLEEEIARKTEELKSLQEEAREISHRTLPDAMNELGIDLVGVPEFGVTIELKSWVKALLPKDPIERGRATDWLVEHGAGELIKSDVKVAFSRSESNMARDLASRLEEELPGQVSIQEDIHHMTYTAWAKEQIESGEVLPQDLLGITSGPMAKVKARKK